MSELIGQHACFGGTQHFYRHDSTTIGLPMRFSVYMPPQAKHRRVPALFYLAGLTCTEETFPIKAGAQRYAAEHGIALIAPDTSPRGANLPGDNDSWDFGVGAGFYLDATESPWSKHYRMNSYVLHELRETVLREFSIDGARLGVFGHSMGGHGALVLALRNRDVFRSVSAFAPIAAPSRCPWGVKAFNGYLGHDDAGTARAAYSDRSGAWRLVSCGATAPGTVRSRLRGGRAGTDAAQACRLRSRLLLRAEFRRRSYSPSCAAIDGLSAGFSRTTPRQDFSRACAARPD
jgi:S-formylglutathione hydrolase